jgi:hypothetical protein
LPAPIEQAKAQPLPNPALRFAKGRQHIAALAVTFRSTHNARMDYQLIIKFYRPSLTDEAFLATIEARLKAALGDTVVLEGFDVSAKEINLFMATADPKHSFRKSKDVIAELGIERGVSAAYRLVGGAKFTSLWPLRGTRKFTLP